MSENTQNQNPKQEQYSLNDDRRVKVLSPGALVAKRFFRNRLAVVGLSILIAMFLFSFVGGLVSPYGQDEQFFTYTQMSKEFVGVTRNDTMRFVVADGQNFGSIAQSKALEAVKKGSTEFNYKDTGLHGRYPERRLLCGLSGQRCHGLRQPRPRQRGRRCAQVQL